MKKTITTLGCIFIALMLFSQEKPGYFLPDDVSYDQNIPTPEEFFGQQLGEWHLTYDQVLYYVKEIARISDRAVLQEYARSHENRPLVHLIFTSPGNHKNLDELKALHLQHADPTENLSDKGVPLVITLGYGVHGNESSATNASVLTAYYLAAAQAEKIDEMLEKSIILVDPCLNPDGFTRHSTWANMHQSEMANGDSNSRQFNEVWPGGRTNHYWFDLNRDYLLLVHPESIGRVAGFYEWLPNIVTDHHEMGANSTFFFQPGVPSRNNPLTPQNNYVLTHEIAAYHARFLDEIGTTYYSEEQFDDYYLGKGSSYPDINSSVGILFEQAGFRGRVRQTSNGMRKLSYGIRNQFAVTLSTLEAAMDLRDELLEHQQGFYVEALQLSKKDEIKAYVFGDENDKLKSQFFANFLQKHQIEVFKNTVGKNINGHTFLPGSSYIVPTAQKQYRLVKAMFDDVATFTDSTFYDVSTWTFPYTFNVPTEEISSLKNLDLSEPFVPGKISGKVIGGKSKLAYLFKWDEYTAPAALYHIQNAGLLTKVASEKFSYDVGGETINFSYGTILIPVNDQALASDQIFRIVENVAKETGIDFYALQTGLSPKGIDLGSRSFVKLDKPNALLFVGGTTSSRDAGEIWHLFDQRYHMPLTLAETNDLRNINLTKYNTVILPGGNYREFSDSEVQKLKDWVSAGGTLIAYRDAAAWAGRNKLGRTKLKPTEKPDTTLVSKYSEREKEYNRNTISGAIFNTKMDISHPLCWGYLNDELPVFKTGTGAAETLGTRHAEPVRFSDKPFLSGFVSAKNLERIANAPVVSVQEIGLGKIISYHESMTFRGIWLGTNKLFANGIFFGPIVR